MKLQPLYKVKCKTVKVSEFGSTPDGARSNYHMEGEVRGRINGKFHAIDYGLSRIAEKQGPVVLHVHETIETDDGLISVERRGYAIPNGKRYRVKSTLLFQTGGKKHSFLNSTVAVAEGYADAEGVNYAVYEVM